MPLAAQIIEEAKSWLGTPYCHQASCKGSGVDCLGLVYGIYRAVYPQKIADIPAYLPYAENGAPEILWQATSRHLAEIERHAATPGDILLFRIRRSLPARHMAVLMPDKYILHAVQNYGVIMARYGQWWQSRCVSAFRFPDHSPARV